MKRAWRTPATRLPNPKRPRKSVAMLLLTLPIFFVARRNSGANTTKNTKEKKMLGAAAFPASSRTRIVASFKTIPSRIQFIEPTLVSLLEHQSMRLDSLYVVMPRKKWILKKDEAIQYEVPSFLSRMAKEDKRLVILTPEYDYGPVDKMLHPLLEESSLHGLNAKVIYLDDDVTYDGNLVRTLVNKSGEYPNATVAFSGCSLRSHFRQISHKFPRKEYDKHPNLYYPLSGSPSLPEDEMVDIVQGFSGVLVQPQFFDMSNFLSLVQAVTRHHDVWKADDFIISGYLASRNIMRHLVTSDIGFKINSDSANVDNVGRAMHRQVMQAAHDLKQRLGIWTEHEFVDYLSLDPLWKDLIDCEAGHSAHCEAMGLSSTRNISRRVVTQKEATQLLDSHFSNVGNTGSRDFKI